MTEYALDKLKPDSSLIVSDEMDSTSDLSTFSEIVETIICVVLNYLFLLKKENERNWKERRKTA